MRVVIVVHCVVPQNILFVGQLIISVEFLVTFLGDSFLSEERCVKRRILQHVTRKWCSVRTLGGSIAQPANSINYPSKYLSTHTELQLKRCCCGGEMGERRDSINTIRVTMDMSVSSLKLDIIHWVSVLQRMSPECVLIITPWQVLNNSHPRLVH